MRRNPTAEPTRPANAPTSPQISRILELGCTAFSAAEVRVVLALSLSVPHPEISNVPVEILLSISICLRQLLCTDSRLSEAQHKASPSPPCNQMFCITSNCIKQALHVSPLSSHHMTCAQMLQQTFSFQSNSRQWIVVW